MAAGFERARRAPGVPYYLRRYQRNPELELAVVWGGLDDKRPEVMGWLRRIHARPAHQRALERGGKYDYANA